MDLVCDLKTSLTAHSSEDIQQECQKFFKFKGIQDPSAILAEIKSVTTMVQQLNNKLAESSDSFENQIGNLKQKQELIEHKVDQISSTTNSDVQKLQQEIKLFFNHLIDLVRLQSTKLSKLEKDLDDFRKDQQKSDERISKLEENIKSSAKLVLIGDLLARLVPRPIRRGRKRPFLIVFDSFGSDRITAVFHRIVNEHKRSNTPFSGRLRQLLTVYDTTKNVRYARPGISMKIVMI